MGFKDSNPTFEIVTKTALLWSEFFSHIERWITLYFLYLGWSQWKVDTINKDFNIEICCKGRCKDKNFTGNPCDWVWTPADAHSIYLLSFGSLSDVNHCWFPKLLIVSQAFRCPNYKMMQRIVLEKPITQYGKKKLGSEESCFCHCFKSRVAVFKPHFLRL